MDEDTLWKEQKHAQWNTPDAVMQDLVRRAVGSTIGTRARIVGGENNEVWSITTAAGDDLIMRISRTETFAAERWATEQAYGLGVPAPEVLLVDDDVAVQDTRLAIWLHRTIHGQPLYTIQDEQVARRLTTDLGELLARIHTIPTSGNGRLDSSGRGQDDNFSTYLSWGDDAARANGISQADVDLALRLLEAHRNVWSVPPRLLHGDWLPEHIIVRDDTVVGIIDFGNARSGDPAYDLAYWQFFWDAERYPDSCVLDGYRRVADVGGAFELRFALCRLGYSMRALPFYAEGERSFPAQHSAQRFVEALAWLRANAL